MSYLHEGGILDWQLGEQKDPHGNPPCQQRIELGAIHSWDLGKHNCHEWHHLHRLLTGHTYLNDITIQSSDGVNISYHLSGEAPGSLDAENAY